MNKQILQWVVAIGGFVPVGGGLYGIMTGTNADVNLDSHYRYLSGLLLAIGLGFWSCIPNIERKAPRMRLLTLLVVIGGLARLSAVLIVGAPGIAMRLALVMELVVTPAICLWQTLIKRQALGQSTENVIE